MSTILTINAGSSSLKFCAYHMEAPSDPVVSGQVERLGADARLVRKGQPPEPLGQVDHAGALDRILRFLRDDTLLRDVTMVGHRIVHGGPEFTGPVRLDAPAIDRLRSLIPLAPLHQPHNLACVDAAISAFPQAMQVGCFDTAFHRSHPFVNDTFALPRTYYDEGVRRYGFHGLSYEYISGYLAEHDPDLHAGRVIVAHLGNGASLCAIKNGQSVASTMGFSALDGLPMGTRCGQLDPGVLLYLMDHKGMTAPEITDLLYRQSGLLGLSGVSSDMRTLEASDVAEAAEAIDYFVFRITREIGAMAASMGGVDGLVFTGGIGENSALIRGRVCAPLGFLGIACDPTANAANAQNIGTGPVRVMAINTNEEAVIARACVALAKE